MFALRRSQRVIWNCFIACVLDPGDKFFAGTNRTGNNLSPLSLITVHSLSPLLLTTKINIKLQISLIIFVKIWNCPNRILTQGPGAWKKYLKSKIFCQTFLSWVFVTVQSNEHKIAVPRLIYGSSKINYLICNQQTIIWGQIMVEKLQIYKCKNINFLRVQSLRLHWETLKKNIHLVRQSL